MMTVGQLIALLQKHDPELRVVVDGYEGGLNDVDPKAIRAMNIFLNYREDSYQGSHEEDEGYIPSEVFHTEPLTKARALYIPR